MNAPQHAPPPAGAPPASAKVIALRPPGSWHDPLRLMQDEAPSFSGRVVLWTVSVLVLILIVWAGVGQLDIIASAEGKLVPQTLLKVVQPAEAGIVQALLVAEGERVKAGQVLARLDTTVARADQAGVADDLAAQRMQARRIEAELAGQPMAMRPGDNPALYTQIVGQHRARRNALLNSLEQEKALLLKAGHERHGALQVLAKLEQTLPTYRRSAEAYAKLEKEGFLGGLASADKQREAVEKAKDLEAQHAAVAALDATVAAQQKKLVQLQSNYEADLQRELAEIHARIAQLQPNLNKAAYRAALMELKAPQAGVIKDLATTSVGAVVQPGSVVITLIPDGERLYADVLIKNEDVGFVRPGQKAQIKLATYPFQRYGMLTGEVIHVSADANEPGAARRAGASDVEAGAERSQAAVASYKARIALDSQTLLDPQGQRLQLGAGMQAVAEIKQGQRSVLEYLLSPVQKAVSEAGRER